MESPRITRCRARTPDLGPQFPAGVADGCGHAHLLALPWLDRGKVKSIRYRGPKYRAWFTAFIISFLILGYLGVEPTTVWGEFGKNWPVVGGDYVALWAARVLSAGLLLFLPADSPPRTRRSRSRKG